MAKFPALNGPSGLYGVSTTTGAIGAGAGADSEVLHFRWTDTTKLAVIQEISLTGMRATTAFAAGAIDIKATRATAWTADGSGGTALTMTGVEGQFRTDYPLSVVGTIRISTTAALTAGTKTLDTNDFGRITTHSSGGVGSATPIIGSIYLPTTTLFFPDFASGQGALILEAQEGFVVRATVPATGVWNIGITVKWAEILINRV